MNLKNTQVLGLVLSSILTLNGCAKVELDFSADQVENMIDVMVNAVVDVFVSGNKDTSVGDLAPDRNNNNEFSEEDYWSKPVYYNQALWDGNIHAEIVGNGESFTGGWEIEGILLENHVMDEVSMNELRTISVGDSFSWSYLRYNDSGEFTHHYVTCTKLDENQGIEALSFTFVDEYGKNIIYVVDPDGRICYPSGGYVKTHVDFITLFVPTTARFLDSYITNESRSYDSYDGYFTYRLENNAFYNGEARYWMDFNISSGLITEVHAIYTG